MSFIEIRSVRFKTETTFFFILLFVGKNISFSNYPILRFLFLCHIRNLFVFDNSILFTKYVRLWSENDSFIVLELNIDEEAEKTKTPSKCLLVQLEDIFSDDKTF